MKCLLLLIVILGLVGCSTRPHMSFIYHQKGSLSGGSSGSGNANIFLSHPF